MQKFKKISIVLLVVFLLSTIGATICSAANIPEYYYTIKDGWSNVYTISGEI